MRFLIEIQRAVGEVLQLIVRTGIEGVQACTDRAWIEPMDSPAEVEYLKFSLETVKRSERVVLLNVLSR